MEQIQILFKYSGTYDENGNYRKYKQSGMLMPSDASYVYLCEKIAMHMATDDIICTETVKISYTMDGDSTPLWITNDCSLEFYLDLKKTIKNAAKYPLVVEICKETYRRCNSTTNSSELIQIDTLQFELQVLQITESINSQVTMPYFESMLDITNAIAEDAVNDIHDQVVDSDNDSIDLGGNNDFKVGDVFDTKSDIQKAVGHFAITQQFNFNIIKSCRRKYYVHCIDENCSWKLSSSCIGNTSTFMVRKYCNVHTCSMECRFQPNRHATSKFIANTLKRKFRSTTSSYGPTNIKEDFAYLYGINVDYHKAWRAKEKVHRDVIGKACDSYGDLPGYLFVLEKNNPGTLTRLKTNDDGSFLYVFMALVSSIDGWKHCRPQVVVDGAFLSSAYGGTLLTACTYNAAGGILPLAFAIVDSENNESYHWFFTLFREAYGHREDMCVISDRHDSITNAVKHVYPEVGHYCCVYHLEANLKKRVHKNHDLLHQYLFKAAKAYTHQEFNFYMNELVKMGRNVGQFLTVHVPLEKWASIYSRHHRRQAMTSNIAESMNAVNKKTRQMPVTALMELLRSLCQKWSVRFRDESMFTVTPLTKKYDKVVFRRLFKSNFFKVVKSSEYIYNVACTETGEIFVVNLGTNCYSCRKFQVDEIPCRHALTILKTRNYDIRNYCSAYYLKETLENTYKSVVYPISTLDTMDIPAEVSSIEVNKPPRKPQVGRPRTTRFKAWNENASKRSCSNCKQSYHNKRTCKNMPVGNV